MNEVYRRGRGPLPCVLLAAGGIVAVLSMGACRGPDAANAGPAAGAAATVSARPSTSPTPPAERSTAAAATTAPPAPKASASGQVSPAAGRKQSAHPYYDEALTQWKQGTTATSAQQGEYWLAAASALETGESTDGGNTSGYPAAAADLTDLAGLPDAQQTPAQNAEYHHDIDALNTFFDTPSLYS